SSPAKIGCVPTSAVAEATDVIVRLGTHVPKWTASAIPASTAVLHARAPTRSSRTAKAVTPAPKTLRHRAIASAGAAVAAMSGPENDTPVIATASSAPSRGGGAARSPAAAPTTPAILARTVTGKRRGDD